MNDIESRLLDMLTDLLLNATKRVLALEALLKERGLFSEEEIAAKAQAIQFCRVPAAPDDGTRRHGMWPSQNHCPHPRSILGNIGPP